MDRDLPWWIVSFNGSSWAVYDTSDSGILSNYIRSIATDRDGKVWVGTYWGLTSFDGSIWTVYDESNSRLPENDVFSIAIDGSGNKWIGTQDGLAVFKEGGIVTGIEDEQQLSYQPASFKLHQNYPNPFNPATTISYSLLEQSSVKLTVFNIQGREVMTLQDVERPPGNYEVQWNGMDQSGNPVSTGVYFARLQAGPFSQTIKMVYLR